MQKSTCSGFFWRPLVSLLLLGPAAALRPALPNQSSERSVLTASRSLRKIPANPIAVMPCPSGTNATKKITSIVLKAIATRLTLTCLSSPGSCQEQLLLFVLGGHNKTSSSHRPWRCGLGGCCLGAGVKGFLCRCQLGSFCSGLHDNAPHFCWLRLTNTNMLHFSCWGGTTAAACAPWVVLTPNMQRAASCLMVWRLFSSTKVRSWFLLAGLTLSGWSLRGKSWIWVCPPPPLLKKRSTTCCHWQHSLPGPDTQHKLCQQCPSSSPLKTHRIWYCVSI